MRRYLAAVAFLGIAIGCAPRSTVPIREGSPTSTRPIIIAHRGASGHLPEHTLEAYALAIDMGADYIEPDLVSTKDGVLIARHENEIGGTTDVAQKFPERRRSAVVDGARIEGWFAEDFTLAEIKTLRARERMATRSRANDGKFLVPTFDEVLTLVRRRERETGRTIGVYPETKHPTYFATLDLALEPKLLDALARHGYGRREDAVVIQSFEITNLKRLRSGGAPYRLAQLVDNHGAPYDAERLGSKLSYFEMVTRKGLREIAGYADIVAPDKTFLLPIEANGRLGAPSSLVREAHAAGLEVHIWTLRSDPPNLPAPWEGDALAEWRRYAALGVDGIFSDFPDDGVRALRATGRR